MITLAVAVTLHIQHDSPGEEVDAVKPEMKVQETPKPEAKAEAHRRTPRPFAAAPSAPALAAAPERIARLRAAGRHEEADKALAEFRKRYPNYRIPEAITEKVEKR